jgi:Ni,Fe-hydrogenase III large subunit
MDFFKVNGEEVHEVAVGPVHAGVIEPGHFRFQCHGETVFHLEIALGFQHRGIERALLGGPHPLSLKQAETACGDSSIAHGWAYCRLLESLAGVEVPARTDHVRGVALELERAANHVGDLGALSGDVGFLPTASFCGRIRGDWLNLSAEVCGSRLGRDWLKPGGLCQDLDPAMAAGLVPRLARTWADTRDAVELLWGASSVMIRFEAAGRLDSAQARDIGLVGVPARACGVNLDVRQDHPFGPYRDHPVQASLAESGNVQSRAWVRWLELAESQRFLAEALEVLAGSEPDPRPAPLPPLAADSLCVSLTEGWRGEVLHLALTDNQGRFARYKIVDPSFHNWFGLALALRGEQVSDFPLCNKSFNLSYCGHDL